MAEYIEREAMMLDFERRYRDYRARSEKHVIGGIEIDNTLQVSALVMKSCLDTMHDAPAADVVPIDDMFGEMMNWAVRYALGRRTYAATDTARYITPLVPRLSNKTLWAMRDDLKPNTPWNPNDYGDPCDKVEWMKLLDAVNAELDRRAVEADG